MSELGKIRTRHEAGERAGAVERALNRRSADDDRAWLLGEVERLARERNTALEHERWLLAEAKRLRAERDALLLDAREFVRWFPADYITPWKHLDHPWGRINDRLNAHADTLAALDAAMADKGSGR